jgi:hypothetical protein
MTVRFAEQVWPSPFWSSRLRSARTESACEIRGRSRSVTRQDVPPLGGPTREDFSGRAWRAAFTPWLDLSRTCKGSLMKIITFRTCESAMLTLCAAVAFALLGVTIVSHDSPRVSQDASLGDGLRAHMQPIQPFDEQFVPNAASPGIRATDLRSDPSASGSHPGFLAERERQPRAHIKWRPNSGRLTPTALVQLPRDLATARRTSVPPHRAGQFADV